MHKLCLQIVTCTLWFSISLYAAYLTPYLTAMGVSAGMAGLVIGVRYIVQIFLRLPVGMCSDDWGKQKRFIVLGMLLLFVASFVMYLFPSLQGIFTGSIIAGLAGTMYVAFTVLYEKYYPPEEKNKAMSTITAMVDVGIVCSCFFGGLLYKGLGMRSVFLVSSIVSAVGLIVSFFVKDEPTQKIEPTMQEFYQTVKNKELLVSAFLCNLVNIVVAGTAIAFTPKIAIDLGASGIEVGIIDAVFMISSALASLFVASKWGKKLGNTRTVVVGFVILTAYAASIPFVRSIPLLMVVQLLGGLGYAPLTSIFMANSVRHLPLEQQATGMGYYQSLYSIGSAIGPILLGALADALSYKTAFLLVSLIALVGIPCALLASHKKLMD